MGEPVREKTVNLSQGDLEEKLATCSRGGRDAEERRGKNRLQGSRDLIIQIWGEKCDRVTRLEALERYQADDEERQQSNETNTGKKGFNKKRDP